MSLLQVLQLPVAAVGKPKEKPQSTVTLVNTSGSALRLLGWGLDHGTARFVPPAPGRIASHGQTVFRVEESTVGAAKTAGWARYHVERKRHEANVKFVWGGGKTNVVLEGKGPFSIKIEAREDSETGNTYRLFFTEDFTNEDKREVGVRLGNSSGVTLTLVSATVADPAHSEFGNSPHPSVPDKGIIDWKVSPLDDEHIDGAGTVVYRIESTPKPHVAQLSWRRAEAPVAKLVPDDGAFIVNPYRNSDDQFAFVFRRPGGPPPDPRGPARITVVNRAGFALTHPTFTLDGKKAQFKPPPPERIEGDSKGQFAVESTDPEFPETGGVVNYDFKLEPPDPATPNGEHTLTLAWSDTLFAARISPPAKDCDVVKTGGHVEGFVYTVTGPALAFEPPAKLKQPTLRKDDKNADGWVEYLQEALNRHINAGLEVDGDFGGQTLKAVKAFQRKFKKEGVLEDGIVGDQTWSYLREGMPQKVGTDKRKPHSYVEKGVEARWMSEKGMLWYDEDEDVMIIHAISVGDVTQIEGRNVRFQIVAPDGRQKVIERPILKGQKTSKTGQGFQHNIAVKPLSTLFGTADGGPLDGEYQVQAYFPGDLGGDSYSGAVVVPKKR